ncbi:putative intermediate filament protein [Polychaeton citri CBS 116435]|uniref:Intermediate filament protein n=1 Tax=Polychaeton citri CBS 116435 TaxID=1314669 RepID=A0A9P4QD50_9PEZI|nr:putative intermediate filament protein [Polychaeton citri CBS 116435]
MVLDREYVIAGAVVGFISWAFLTDFLPSLRWIPHSLLFGAATALLGTLYVVTTTSRSLIRDSNVHSLGNATRPRTKPARPSFTLPQHWEEEKAVLNARLEYRRPKIFPTAIVFSGAVDTLLDLILRDYVTSWYGAITQRKAFQHEIDRSIRSALLAIAARLSNIDVVELGVSKALPLVTAHLRDFYDAEHAVKGKDLSHSFTESEELDSAIATKYRQGNLHPVASLANSDTAMARQSHLRNLIAALLPVVLPETMKTSAAVTVLVKEIVTCAVLGPVIQMLLDPDTWNQLIVSFGGAMLHDRKTVRKLRAALDQHAPPSPNTKTPRAVQIPRLRPHDSERQFERFIRAIRHAPTVSDSRRFRSEIMSQLRRDSLVEGQDAAYLRRLETGKRLLDQKIASFNTAVEPGARPSLNVHPPSTISPSREAVARKRQVSLRELLHDASGLSYFMEFMDRQRLMRLVQFWLVADSFRGPLEGDNDEPAPAASSDPASRMDISQIYEGYLSRAELQTAEPAIRAVRRYLKAGSVASYQEYASARWAVLQTQTEVYNKMKDVHYENFKRSDLYYKWLAIGDSHSGHSDTAISSTSPLGSSTSPVKARKNLLAPTNKEPELRRAVLSTSDLKSTTNKSVNAIAEARRSLDDNGIRPALFDDNDIEDERMTQSLTSLRSSHDTDNEETEQARDQANAVNAMQLALTDIVDDDHDRDSLFAESTHSRPSLEEASQHRSLAQRTSTESIKPELIRKSSEKVKPSIKSLGLISGPSTQGVFVDDLFGHEEKHFSEDEREDSDSSTKDNDDPVQEAAPGDLGLTEAIDALGNEIDRLKGQKDIVESLTAKAELTNNAPELRILRKSEQSLQREIKRKEMQRQQYVAQESENSLYGRAALTVKSVMVGREDDGREFALYVIEVRRQASEELPAATWVVTRRYSQFHELHKRLRARFPAIKDLDFPRRQTLFTLQRDFLQKRRVILERYLRSLLLVPAICRSRELRAFLSQSVIAPSSSGNGNPGDASRDFVTRIYNSVSDGMEEFLGNIPVLDQLSIAGQNLISSATAAQQAQAVSASGATAIPPPAIDSLDPAIQDPATSAEAEAELNAFNTTTTTREGISEAAASAAAAEPFVKPICDLFLETFNLSRGNSWLRGRTVVIILHQLLGGTIERKVRESADSALEDESLAHYINLLKDTMWPDGKMKAAVEKRTDAEKQRTKKEAALLLETLVPDLAGSVVGRANAVAAAGKLSRMLNNERLNAHLIFEVVDCILGVVFPEIKVEKR